jgi:hypothetical protein
MQSIDAPGKIELERLDSGVKASTLDEILEKLKEGSNYSASSSKLRNDSNESRELRLQKLVILLTQLKKSLW